MSLYGALSAGVSGMNAQSNDLALISDNIANVNTVGYKGSYGEFSTLVTQQSLPNSYAAGGVNFNRIGQFGQQGILQSTSSPTDVAVAGKGFFVVNTTPSGATASDQFMFTRAGSFTTDNQGNLVNTAGYYLQGWPTDPSGTPTTANTSVLSNLQTINVSGVSGTATATSKITLGINLPAAATDGESHTTNVEVFDSLGVAHDVAFDWTKSTVNQWSFSSEVPTGAAMITALNSSGQPTFAQGQLSFTGQPADGDTVTIGGTTYEFDSNSSVTAGNTAVSIGTSLPLTLSNLATAVGDPRVVAGASAITFTQTSAGAALTVNPNSSAISQTATGSFTLPALTGFASAAVTFNGNGTPASFNLASLSVSGWGSGAADSSIALDLGTVGTTGGLTQFSTDYTVNKEQQDGVQFGAFSGVSISDQGIVSANFTNGLSRAIYKIPLVSFTNPNGLITQNGNAFLASDNSGVPILDSAKNGGLGSIQSGSLETSTVDLGTEFTNMIIAQRAYSANTKIITTVDQMLQELVQLKQG